MKFDVSGTDAMYVAAASVNIVVNAVKLRLPLLGRPAECAAASSNLPLPFPFPSAT